MHGRVLGHMGGVVGDTIGTIGSSIDYIPLQLLSFH